MALERLILFSSADFLILENKQIHFEVELINVYRCNTSCKAKQEEGNKKYLRIYSKLPIFSCTYDKLIGRETREI